MYLIHVEETPGYVLDQIRSSVELAEMFSLWQTLFSAPLLKLQIDARGTCLVLLMWKCDRTQVKGFLYLFQREESLNMDQPRPYMKPYLKQDLMAIASCCICVACRKRWMLRSLRSKTDSAKACSTWLGCQIKASALLRVEQSLTTHLHHEMPSLTCRHSLMVFFIVCFLPHKKRHQSSPPEANHRTSEPLNCRHRILATVQVQGCPWHLACSPRCIRYFSSTPPSLLPSLPSLYYQLHTFYTEPSWEDVWSMGKQRNT